MVIKMRQSLYFKLDNKRYLFGMTHSLALDAIHTCKLKINYLILPTNPYLINTSVFMWHLQALETIPCNNIIVSQQSVKKKLERLLQNEKNGRMAQLKWEFMRQHQIKEQFLINKLNEQQCRQPLRFQPNGLCFNGFENMLSIIVPENGQSLILIHCCQIILVDPNEKIQETLNYYGLPLRAVETILLTRSNNLNFFECMMKLSKFSIVAEEKIYIEVKKGLKNYFYWNDKMIKNRVTAKVLVEKGKKHKYKSLEWVVYSNQQGQTEYWEIQFGLKIFRIYPQKLTYFPIEIITNVNFEYGVFNDVQDNIKKQLQEIPQIYRKKIIVNRVRHKYNNQYFVKLTESNPFVCIKSQLKQEKRRRDLAFQMREQDINARLQVQKIQENIRMNAKERSIYVREGYIRDQFGKINNKGHTIFANRFIDFVGKAKIMYESINNLNFYQKYQRIWKQKNGERRNQNLLIKVKENSFVKKLNKKCQTSGYGKVQEIQEIENDYQISSQWDLVNRICQIKTLESNSKQLEGKKCLYLIVKGSMKFNNSQKIATKCMGVCKLKSFYDKQLDEGEEIQIIKDSWVIEINLQNLQEQLFEVYGEKMYELLSKTEIFL